MNNNEQLRLLSIFHYVVGGLHALFSSFGLIHFFIGITMISNPEAWNGTSGDAPPPWFGLLFAVVGGGIVLTGWTFGFLTILSGRYIARRVRRTFSTVIAAINCALFPFGTALGVFTIIVLNQGETKEQYEAQGNGSTPPPLK